MTPRTRLALALGVAVPAALGGAALAPSEAPAPVRPQLSAGASPASVREVPGLERRVVAGVNVLRRAEGLAPLRADARLRRAARGHSRYLARTGVLSHAGARGGDHWARIAIAGYPAGRATGETIAMAMGCPSAAALAARVVAEWMRSAPHRDALLDDGFRAVGVGAATTAGCDRATVVANTGG